MLLKVLLLARSWPDAVNSQYTVTSWFSSTCVSEITSVRIVWPLLSRGKGAAAGRVGLVDGQVYQPLRELAAGVCQGHAE